MTDQKKTEENLNLMDVYERENGFCITVDLPAEVDPSRITAQAHDKILIIQVAKVGAPKPSKIAAFE